VRCRRQQQAQPPKPDHFGNPHAPQVFADEVPGYWVSAGWRRRRTTATEANMPHLTAGLAAGMKSF
jgi:hypothetical protein